MTQATLNIERARELLALIDQKKSLSSRLDYIKDQIAVTERAVMDDMAKNGVPRIPLSREDGSSVTLYINRRIWARPKDDLRNDVVDALKAAGLTMFVKEDFNVLTISSWVSELVKAAREKGDARSPQEIAADNLPSAELAEKLEITEDHRISARNRE